MKLVFNLPQCCTTGFFGNLGERPLYTVFMEQKGFVEWKMAKPKNDRESYVSTKIEFSRRIINSKKTQCFSFFSDFGKSQNQICY